MRGVAAAASGGSQAALRMRCLPRAAYTGAQLAAGGRRRQREAPRAIAAYQPRPHGAQGPVGVDSCSPSPLGAASAPARPQRRPGAAAQYTPSWARYFALLTAQLLLLPLSS